MDILTPTAKSTWRTKVRSASPSHCARCPRAKPGTDLHRRNCSNGKCDEAGGIALALCRHGHTRCAISRCFNWLDAGPKGALPLDMRNQRTKNARSRALRLSMSDMRTVVTLRPCDAEFNATLRLGSTAQLPRHDVGDAEKT